MHLSRDLKAVAVGKSSPQNTCSLWVAKSQWGKLGGRKLGKTFCRERKKQKATGALLLPC